MMKSQTNQARILNQQVEEAERKAAAIFAEQERRRIEMKNAIEKSRKMQIGRK